jgi:hypothetical protein
MSIYFEFSTVTRSTRNRGDARRPLIVSALILSLFLGCGGSGQQNRPPKAETPIPTNAATNSNLTVNGSQTFQTMDGMGVNINVNSWNGGQLAPALDLLVRTNGSSLIRVIRDPMDWVTSESLIPALHSLDPVTLQQVYETPKMQDIWNTIGSLNLIGVGGNQIILNFMGWTPTWLGGSGAFRVPSHITAGKEQQFATMIASLIYYGRRVRNLDFLLLTPLNESDHDCLEGPCVDASQYVTILRALIAELDNMGLSDVRLVGPDTANIGAGRGYISLMMADSIVAGRVDHFGEHTYGNSASPGTPFPSKNYWLTESAAACGSCDTGGTVTGGEWNFARATTDDFLGDLASGYSGILVYDAYDSFYYHHNNFGFWGLLAFNQSTGTYTPRARFYANAQLNRFIRPGAVRIGVNTSVPGVTVVAFYHPLSGQVSIVGHNTDASPVTINGLLQSLPLVNSLAPYQTNASLNLQHAADISVVGGAFSVSIPADTFFSMTN